ncbi:hypothetical protein EMIT040CA3_10405 [Bacillus pseudomycoides]
MSNFSWSTQMVIVILESTEKMIMGNEEFIQYGMA